MGGERGALASCRFAFKRSEKKKYRKRNLFFSRARLETQEAVVRLVTVAAKRKEAD